MQPPVERYMAGLVDGANFDRELLAAGIALLHARPSRRSHQGADLLAVRVAAMGARRAVRPEQTFKECVGCGFLT